MKHQIKEIDGFTIIGSSLRTTNENNQSSKDIAEFWQRFFAQQIPEKIPNKKSHALFGLYTDYEKDHTKPYTLILGSEVTQMETIPDDLTIRHIPAGRYAIIDVDGKFPESLMHAWHWVWDSDLERSFTHDFEYYSEDFNPETNPAMQLYIAIK